MLRRAGIAEQDMAFQRLVTAGMWARGMNFGWPVRAA
jgi:hypothetical protein